MLKGSITALITPFRDGKIDEAAFRRLIDWQIESGTDGLVPVGTTGESPTVSHTEHRHVVEVCVDAASGRVPVIAGAGSNCTDEAIGFAQHAKKAGADYQLSVAPYYNKPTQEGLYRHFKAIHDATDLPMIIYNIPGRSIVDISVETMTRLAELPHVAGVKDATADLARPLQQRVACGPEFIQLSGEDATAIPFLAQGGLGCISVTSNVAPAICAEMHDAWAAGNLDRAMELNELLLPLHDALFCETSPGPVKYAASLLGLCSAEARLPVCEIADSTKRRVEEVMTSIGLLEKGKVAKAG